MPISEHDTIDYIGRRPKTGEVLLIIRETTNWRDPNLPRLLERKINTYQYYAGSTAYEQKFGKAPYQICLHSRYRPTRQIQTVLEKTGVRVLSE